MKTWIKHLSQTQQNVLLIIVLIALSIILLGYFLQPEAKILPIQDFSIHNSIRENAKKLGVTGKALARELKLNIEVSKSIPISQLGVSPENFYDAVSHLLSHQETSFKYYIYFAIALFSLFYLRNLGKAALLPDNSYKHHYPLSIYILILCITLIINGFILGKSPNPMESIVKVFKAFAGLYQDPVIKISALLFFLGLSVVANKIICGWLCPFGALQEIIYSIPIFTKIKKKKPPFWLTNSIRFFLLLFMVLILFAIIGNKKGMVTYHYINPFNLFNFDFEPISIMVALIISLIASFIVYRPFCQFICPFGLISWLFERISLFKIRINHELCTKCNACIRVCPTQASKGILEKKKFPPDCFSCTRCLRVCAFKAIAYQSPFRKK
jgi:polyferredoxin